MKLLKNATSRNDKTKINIRPTIANGIKNEDVQVKFILVKGIGKFGLGVENKHIFPNMTKAIPVKIIKMVVVMWMCLVGTSVGFIWLVIEIII
ncbi:hypothetical protein ACFLZX_02615 [Nanoarchaeota archaeon]